MAEWFEKASNEDILHYGIKGMKWGVRRYQNEDGTLTAAGKRRVRQGIKKRDKIIESQSNSKKYRKATRKFNKHYRKLTDSEVNELIKKIKRDNEFRTLNDIKDSRYDVKKKDVGTMLKPLNEILTTAQKAATLRNTLKGNSNNKKDDKKDDKKEN